MTSAECRQVAGMLPDRTFAALWLIGHGCMFVFVVGMVRVMGNG